MKLADDNEQLFFSYLLGEAGGEEEERIEQRYLGDQQFYDRLLVAEDELIDSYVRGELSDARRERFENHFLRSPGRRERVAFAQSWMKYVSDSPKLAPLPREEARGGRRVSYWPFKRRLFLIPLAAAVLLAVVGSLLYLHLARLRNELDQVRSDYAALETKQQELQQQIDEQSAQNAQLARQLEERSQPGPEKPAEPGPRSGALATLIYPLTPGLLRGSGGMKEVVIPPETQSVGLQLIFRHGGHKSYEAVLETVDGERVTRKAGLTPQPKGGKAVLWRLRADLLGNKDYIITLSGTDESGGSEEVENYTFRVVKK